MKKTLLSIAGVLFTVVATAQNVSLSFAELCAKKNIELKPIAKSNKSIDASKVFTVNVADTKKTNRAEGTDVYPYGEWVYVDIENENNHVVNQGFTMEQIEEVDEEGNTYNVGFKSFGGYVFTPIANYDEEAGTLTIPQGQVVWDNPDAYGACAIYGFDGEEGEEFYCDLVFEKDENGNFFMTNKGYQVLIVNEESEYYNYCLVEGTEVAFYQPNGTCTFQAPTKTDYQEVTSNVYIEDYGEEMSVYGMFSYAGDASVTSIRIEDNKAYIDSDQQVDSEDQSEYIKKNYNLEGDFGYLRFVVWLEKVGEEYYISTDDSDVNNFAYGYSAYLPGDIVDNTITFHGYFTFATDYVDGAGALNYGNFKGLKLEMFKDNTEGISEVKTNVASSTKTFNLMGQQVNRANVKGIVIRDGKKLMMK